MSLIQHLIRFVRRLIRLQQRFIRFLVRRENPTKRKISELDQALTKRAQRFGSNVILSRSASIIELTELVRDAWALGQSIELRNIFYGPAHWKGRKKFHDDPVPYYHFLAGFVRLLDCRLILEIGTHYGGSSLAMLRGMRNANEPKIVTVDITDLNKKIHGTPGIIKLTGDASDEATIREIVLKMDDTQIDLIYLDADHKFAGTLTYLGLYCLLLRPRFVIIDGIILNQEMRSMWDILGAAYAFDGLDCTKVVPRMRPPGVGFGLLRLR